MEDGLVIVDEIDLVDRQHDVPDAEHRGDQRMTSCLRQDPLARVDQQDREIRRRGARGHVAGIFLVAGRIGNDELALLGGEEPVGDIDGDALFALRLQAVHEQREVDVVAGGAVLDAVALQRRQLVLEDALGVIEKTSDQGRLAVVHRTAGQEPQKGLGFLLSQIFGDGGEGLA